MENKIAVITGATSGIGAAYATEFARRGYDLILTGRRKEIIERNGRQIHDTYGVEVHTLIAELSKEEELEKILDFIRGKKVEVLVNNAGFGIIGRFHDTDLNSVCSLADVNVLAPIKLIHQVLPGMIKRDKGIIINISSESIYMVVPGNAAYSGVKAFLKSFSEGLAMDLYGTGVKVMAVCPGLTHTDFHRKLGMNPTRQISKGLIQWMSPEKVVKESLKDLKEGCVVSIPGLHTKLLAYVFRLMPSKIYYKTLYQFSQKNFSK
jgi:short-subunit dehydrogenase